jgi:hypothetical protein
LNALFAKEETKIEQKRQEWSKWTVEQCRRGANTMVDDGNGNLVRACVKGGTASIEEKRKSPARDANYKMANGDAPENDLQQFASEGGKIGGPAMIEERKESPARDTNYEMARWRTAMLLRTTTNRWAQKAAMQGQRTDNSG